MRALRVATIVMGVMIVAAVALLAVLLAGRLGGSGAPAALLRLDEPAGTRIVGVAALRDRLAVALSGGGTSDRVLLLDPGSGRVSGRIELAR